MQAAKRDMRGADAGLSLIAAVTARLWREDPAEVTAIVDAITLAGTDDAPSLLDGRHGLRAERLRELHRPLPPRRKQGVTINDMAKGAGVDQETMARALEHHGFLTLAPFGGRQSRRLVSDQAFAAGYGHNCDGSVRRVAQLEGFNRACVFPVFYPEHLPSIMRVLDFDSIREKAAALPSKRDRLRWMMANHGYLPAGFIADVAGCTRWAVEKARARQGESPVTSYR